MAINARTFQILYIARQQAQVEEPVTAKSISAFIAARRKSNPTIYSKAYIAPSALVQALQRMTTGEGLLTNSSGSSFDMTVLASQMADLVTDIDACSTRFIGNYKEEICRAVLQQRQRLGQGPVNPREIAALSNISLDSARRGVAALVEKDECLEDRSSRTPTYELSAPAAPPATSGNDFVTDGEDGVVTPGGLDDEAKETAVDTSILDTLAEIDEGEIEATDGPVVPLIDDDVEDNIVPLSLVLDDDGPDDEAKPATTQEQVEQYLDDKLGAEADADPYDWSAVSDAVREGHIARAKACGMTLSGYFGMLNRTHERMIREALEGETPRILIQLPELG